jgi:hypothetical protein
LSVNSFAVDTALNAQHNTDALPLASEALLHELQLGEQLNACVSETRRADFSLMLAMLAQDVREQSQFLLPKNDNSTHGNDAASDNAKLRSLFQLPPEEPLALKSLDDIALFNQAELIESNRVATLHLSNAMNPRALAFRDNHKHIETDVITNTSLYCQLLHSQKADSTDLGKEESDSTVNGLLSKPLGFNANAWLKGIDDSLVKAPLIA